MDTFFNNLLFGYYPYVAGTVFLLGSLVRFDMSQYTWKTNSSQIVDSSSHFRLANNLFHIGVLFLFFGHLVGLLTPHSWEEALRIQPGLHQIIAMTSGGIFGLCAVIGGAMLIHRRLTNPRVRAQSSQMDTAIIIILFIQLLLGLGTIPFSAQHLDGSEMMLLSAWAQHIVTFQPGAAAFIAKVSWMFKIHLFLGLTIFLLFPFTRLVHIWSAPIWYLGRRYQIVRMRHG